MRLAEPGRHLVVPLLPPGERGRAPAPSTDSGRAALSHGAPAAAGGHAGGPAERVDVHGCASTGSALLNRVGEQRWAAQLPLPLRTLPRALRAQDHTHPGRPGGRRHAPDGLRGRRREAGPSEAGPGRRRTHAFPVDPPPPPPNPLPPREAFPLAGRTIAGYDSEGAPLMKKYLDCSRSAWYSLLFVLP